MARPASAGTQPPRKPQGRLITLEEFGEAHDPPLSRWQMVRHCQEGRVIGATKPGREWLVAEDAVIMGLRAGLTPQKLADREGVSREYISKLLRQGRIPEADRLPNGRWDIPHDAELPELISQDERTQRIREGRRKQLENLKSLKKKGGKKSKGGQQKARK